MIMILNTLGIPADRVTYIIVVDWLIDRFRTAVNVFGDGVGAVITQQWTKKRLDELDFEEEERRRKELAAEEEQEAMFETTSVDPRNSEKSFDSKEVVEKQDNKDVSANNDVLDKPKG